MARIASVVGIIRAVGLASWREVRSVGSIGGQNLFLFVIFMALQPESAAFFGLLFAAVLLFPLATDPLEKVPQERRKAWPILRWEWSAVRLVTLALSPVVWVALFMVWRAGWRLGAQVFLYGLSLYLLKAIAKLSSLRKLSTRWHFRIPAPPGAVGALMRLQWREMLHTLDPYVAFSLMAATTLYRIFGKALDPSALRVMSLVVALAISTETQVLLGIDGGGAERFRQFPLMGWRLLLAKDLAFLVLLGLLVAPLDFVSGMFGGLAALAVGHHRSVLKPIRQMRWRFTAGAIWPDGIMQTVALFAVGSTVGTEKLPFMALCLLAWVLSLLFYGWQWDRRRYRE